MIVYEVTSVVEAGLWEEYERFIRGRHIPDMMATGNFVNATFEHSDPGRYRVRYVAATREALEHYLSDHAPRLRADFLDHFPTGAKLEREVWQVVESFA